MASDKLTISIVIPSHNRSASLKRLLNKLGEQSFPAQSIQVIVVADGCKDDTLSMLKSYQSSFGLEYIELPGEGAAIARNKGAALATGELLLFLDDDIDPSKGLVEAHVKAHQNDHTVVIGYLPLATPPKAGFFKLELRSWWEQKFQQMRMPGYRYNYEDLLSGNVSLALKLFKQVQGFDTKLRCREDYELGIRLIKSNAEFVFSHGAWGFHRDEITDLDRSLKRKRQEGKADVQFWYLHPDITSFLQDAYLKNQYTFLQSKAVFFVINWPRITDAIAYILQKTLRPLEVLRLRSQWSKINHKLHIYWYLRGLLDELHTRKKLNEYLQHNPCNGSKKAELEIDLKHGITAAEEQLDKMRPASVRLMLGEELIGSISAKPGTERLRGVHLRAVLANELSTSFLKTMALEKLINEPAEA
jgi:glycosyltransferase involved in cell wall biosynthesis